MTREDKLAALGFEQPGPGTYTCGDALGLRRIEKKCTCGDPATRRAGKSGRTGNDVCERCWKLDFKED